MAAPILAAQRRSIDAVAANPTRVVPFEDGAPVPGSSGSEADENAAAAWGGTEPEEKTVPTPAARAVQCAKALFRRPSYGSILFMAIDVYILCILFLHPFRHSEGLQSLHAQLALFGDARFGAVTDTATFYNWLDRYIADVTASSKTVSGLSFGQPSFDFQSEVPLMTVGSLGRVTQLRRKRLPTCNRPAVLQAAEKGEVADMLLMMGLNCSAAYSEVRRFGHQVLPDGTVGAKCPLSNFTYATWGDSGRLDDSKAVEQDAWTSQELASMFDAQNPLAKDFANHEEASPGEYGAYKIDYGRTPMPEWVSAMKQCKWIDTRTETIVVDTAVMSVSGMLTGMIHHKFRFNVFGAITSRSRVIHKFSMAAFLDRVERDNWGWGYPNAEIGRYLCLTIRDFLYVVKVLWACTSLLKGCGMCCCGFGGQKKTKNAGPADGTKTGAACCTKASAAKEKLFGCLTLAHFSDVMYVVSLLAAVVGTARYDGALRTILQQFSGMGADAREKGGSPYFTQMAPWVIGWSHGRVELIRRISTTISERWILDWTKRMALLTSTVELMRHFNGNRHFAIVPRSLAFAAKDVAFLSIALSILMVAYGGVLATQFGEDVKEFSSWPSTLIVSGSLGVLCCVFRCF
jgi:hypothetical protein